MNFLKLLKKFENKHFGKSRSHKTGKILSNNYDEVV